MVIGKKYPVCEDFNVKQTPTNITNKILESEDKIACYKQWVMEHAHDEQEEILDYDGWDSEKDYYPVIGYKTVNYGREHCDELDKFLENIKEKGLELDFSYF